MKRYFRILIIFLLLFSALVGCNVGKEEVREIIFPAYLINLSGYTPEENKQNIEKQNIDNKWCNNILINNDGSITLQVTEEQIKNWKENIKSNIEKKEKSYSAGGIEINFNKDFSKIEYHMSGESSYVSFATSHIFAITAAIQYQMFSGVDPNDWNIMVTIINSKNNKILDECTLPGGIVKISPEDWE